jgi:hypothetical protein
MQHDLPRVLCHGRSGIERVFERHDQCAARLVVGLQGARRRHLDTA